MIAKLSRFSFILMMVVLLLALTAFSVPTTTVYQAHQANPVMSNADGSGMQLATVYPTHEYRVVAYNWNPFATANYASIEFAPGQYGYAPVQLGYNVVATVKYNVGVICCGSIP